MSHLWITWSYWIDEGKLALFQRLYWEIQEISKSFAIAKGCLNGLGWVRDNKNLIPLFSDRVEMQDVERIFITYHILNRETRQYSE